MVAAETGLQPNLKNKNKPRKYRSKMKNNKIVSLAALLIASMGVAQAQIIISEVDANGSLATDGYGADWFELKNIGASAVNVTGWKMDDNSASFALAVP